MSSHAVARRGRSDDTTVGVDALGKLPSPPLEPRVQLKRAVYRAARGAGLFALARRATAKGLRILCYHGVSPGDLPTFRPRLFMRPATFRARLELLARRRHPVLGLTEALERLQREDLPPGATVLTFDDGFDGLVAHALPVLREFGFPATIYVATEYVTLQLPVLILALQYVLWRTTARSLELDGLGEGLDGAAPLGDPDERARLAVALTRHARGNLADEQARSTWAAEVARRAGVDWDRLVRERGLHMMRSSAIAQAARDGVDIQLHSHVHVLTDDEDQVKREVRVNRDLLAPLVDGQPLTHFCYPSGHHRPSYEAWLADLGVVSSTTCEPGLNYAATPRHYLRRFVDAETVDPVTVDAELAGVAELLRRGRRALRAR